ncbi:unnamed protein product [Notodromas monacha]|uniref:Uncharacterized protein n=1 Tax=Notodromas monacha TaxID=399045 RepID=A0A7R9GEI3_9CRUS|nr:unnamed protein product [Notodromas monacha]CAG0917903.1 unnamed protein product [Notodromas monacha]
MQVYVSHDCHCAEALSRAVSIELGVDGVRVCAKEARRRNKREEGGIALRFAEVSRTWMMRKKVAYWLLEVASIEQDRQCW